MKKNPWEFEVQPDGFVMKAIDEWTGRIAVMQAYWHDKALQERLEGLGYMRWEEITPDTVFVEDASYLLKIRGSEYGCFVGYYAKEKFTNDHSDDRLPPEFFSHYAKITEPWKKPQPL